jgi:hypothetical protein
MRIRFIISSVILAWGISGCNRPDAPDCFQRAGVDDVLAGTLIPFDQLYLQDNLNYVLHIDSVWHYTVEGPVNWIPEIKFKNTDSTLTVSNDNHCSLLHSKKRKFTIHIYAPRYHNFIIQSQGTLICEDTLRSSYIDIHYNNSSCNSQWLMNNDSCNIDFPTGTGNLELYGRTQHAWIYSNAIGVIDARNWKTQETYVHQNSLQDMYIDPVNYLHAEIHNKGNLLIKQFPALYDLNETDEGRLMLIP